MGPIYKQQKKILSSLLKKTRNQGTKKKGLNLSLGPVIQSLMFARKNGSILV
jgi:hypothetical protein